MSDPTVIDITDCDKEPIHIPGSIQSHGVLLVLSLPDLEVLQTSANTLDLLGLPPDQVLGRQFPEWVDAASRESLTLLLRDCGPAFSNPLRVPIITDRKKVVFDGVAHRSGETIVLELENPVENEAAESPSGRSVDHYFRLIERCVWRIRDSRTVEESAHIVCEAVREFTGFDRVMLYRFATDFHGEVIGEARREDLAPMMGLHFPASDIPKQARELYKKNWIRLIHDVRAETAPLVPSERRLDMTHCVLRSVSPIHIQYLKNMMVDSSMSISLMNNEELWGLIACHHSSGPHFVSYARRVSCVHFGLVISAQILAKEREIAAQEQSSRRQSLIQSGKEIVEGFDPATPARFPARTLMEIVQADGIAIVRNQDIILEGSTPGETFTRQLLEALEAQRPGQDWFQTERLSRDLPELESHPENAAGVLVLKMGGDWQAIFYRAEYQHTLRWAGDPNKPTAPARALTPRHSFDEWRQNVRGESRPWTEADLELAKELRASLVAFIVRQKLQLEDLNRELGAKNEELKRFAHTVAHEIRSPLQNMLIPLVMLQDAPGLEAIPKRMAKLGQESGQHLKNLVNDLLRFAAADSGELVQEPVDLDSLTREILRSLQNAEGSEGAVMNIEGTLPTVNGARTQLRQVIENLLTNAIRYRREVPLEVRIHVDRRLEHWVIAVRDNGLGIAPEFQRRIFEMFFRVQSSRPGTGIGLGFCKSVVERHGGEIWIESEPGVGSTFFFTLPVAAE